MSCLNTTFKRFGKLVGIIEKQGSFPAISLKGGDLSFEARKWETREFAPEGTGAAMAQKALMLTPFCYMAGDWRVRQEILMDIGAKFSPSPFALAENSVALPSAWLDNAEGKEMLREAAETIRRKTGAKLDIRKAPSSCADVLRVRMAEAGDFYIKEKGEWIENFMSRLEDDLSRDSFAFFLAQYVKEFVWRGIPTRYPIAPPPQSAAWREERRAMKFDFPILNGCADGLRDFFLRDTFVFEQYAISGKVEVQPGDIVIDGGAFIGDTACYFSRKAGYGGKVFAFEAVPDSARCARENMALNNCRNVEVLPFALSDKKGRFTLALNESAASASRKSDENDPYPGRRVEVTAIPLDEFIREKDIKANFIKADVEGAEMAMLKGAQKTIQRDKPVLAFALYHKRDDFWQIPDLMAKINPEYRFWFRCETEPVIFAKNI